MPTDKYQNIPIITHSFNAGSKIVMHNGELIIDQTIEGQPCHLKAVFNADKDVWYGVRVLDGDNVSSFSESFELPEGVSGSQVRGILKQWSMMAKGLDNESAVPENAEAPYRLILPKRKAVPILVKG